MAKIEIVGFAVFRDENGRATMVEAERLPPSGLNVEPDPRVMREAREKLRDWLRERNGAKPGSDAA